MFQVKRISVRYSEADTMEKQGTRSSIFRYFNEGYSVISQNNGFWILSKKAKIRVTLHCEEKGEYSFNMTREILSYYGRTKPSMTLSKQFERDFRNGNVKIFTDGQTFIIE